MTQIRLADNAFANIAWNLFLLTVGTSLFAFGVKAIAHYHGFVSGGIFGTAMLLSYIDDRLSIGILYGLLNIPVFILGWIYLSKRFMLYTLYAIIVATIVSQFIAFDAGINDRTLAAIATGICCGMGAGISLRSLGSDGGLTIIAIILHSKFGINVGTFNLVFNALLFSLALPIIKIDNVLYSMIITYLTSTLMNYSITVFEQRKLMFIISEKHQAISDSILKHLGRGCTLLHGRGAFTKQEREILMTVVHNLQLRRVEEIIYDIDPSAFVIIETTHRVIGKGFSQRQRY